MNRRSHFTLLSAALLLLATVGCDHSIRVPLGQLEGIVVYRGQPVDTAAIHLHEQNGLISRGQIIDGKIVFVSTYEINDGAPVGELIATIHEQDDGRTPAGASHRRALPTRYKDVSTTDLKIAIRDGTNAISVVLQD